MALTFTITGLQTVLEEVNSAITSEDWPAAMKAIARANLVLAGLPASAASDTQAVTMRQDLRAAQDMVLAARRALVNNKRMVRVGVRHQTSTDKRIGGR